MSEFNVVSAVSLPQQLKEESLRGVRAWNDGRARSKQKGIGASDIGNPCTRKLAYAAVGAPKKPQMSDPWAAIVGTACHSGPLHEAFRDSPDWLLDLRLEIAPELWGTLDRYHVPTATIVDDKVLSKDAMEAMKAKGPGPQYRTQVHCYGFGMTRRGHDVKNVALCCWPRSGRMVDAYVWVEPYNEDIVEQAFVRWFGLKEAAPALTPEVFRALAKADGPCGFCSYHDKELAKTNPELACGGWRSGH